MYECICSVKNIKTVVSVLTLIHKYLNKTCWEMYTWFIICGTFAHTLPPDFQFVYKLLILLFKYYNT